MNVIEKLHDRSTHTKHSVPYPVLKNLILNEFMLALLSIPPNATIDGIYVKDDITLYLNSCSFEPYGNYLYRNYQWHKNDDSITYRDSFINIADDEIELIVRTILEIQ